MLVMAVLTTILLLCSFLFTSFSPSKSGSVEHFDSYSDQVESFEQCPLKTTFSGPQCEPRSQIVKLPLPLNFPEVAEVLPAFAEVQRCSGNCHQENDFHKCVPVDESKTMKITEVIFRTYTNDLLCSSIELEEHTECKCGCNIDASSCLTTQEFDEFYCKCRCRDENQSRANCREQSDRKFWDEESCRCICNPQEFRECSSGFVYDAIDTCSCVSIFRGSSIDGGGTMRAGTQTLIPIITFLVLSIGLVIILAVLLWKTRSALNVATQKINQNHEAQQLTTATT